MSVRITIASISLVIAAWVLRPGPAEAEAFKGTRTLSMDSGYVPSLTSNRAFWQFGIEFEGAGSLLLDGLDGVGLGSSALTRASLAVGSYLLWPEIQESYFVANHELGHGSRITALGFEPYYVWRSKGNAHANIFSFFVEGLSTGGAAFTATSGGFSSVMPPANWTASLIAGGMNNSTMFAEALEDHVLLGDGHFMEYMAYVRAKQDAANYVQASESGSTGGSDDSNDVSNILSHYAGRGYGISGSDIEAGSQLSRWLSATHWAYGLAAFRYVFGGDPSVPRPALGPLKLPDFSHYLMDEGLSFKVRTALLASSAQYPIELEYVYKGDAVVEASVGYRGLRPLARGRMGVNWLQLYLNSKGAFGAKAQHDSPLGERLIGSLGASLYHSSLLEGQRNIARFASTDLGYEAWGRVSWVY